MRTGELSEGGKQGDEERAGARKEQLDTGTAGTARQGIEKPRGDGEEASTDEELDQGRAAAESAELGGGYHGEVDGQRLIRIEVNGAERRGVGRWRRTKNRWRGQ